MLAATLPADAFMLSHPGCCANCGIGRHRIAHVSTEPFKLGERTISLHRYRCLCPLCPCPVRRVDVDVADDSEQTYLLRVTGSADNADADTVPFELLNSAAVADPTLSLYVRIINGLRKL